MIIGQAGNIDRFASKHHFASYNATAPVEASSGSKVRHRLNQRGNRQLNWALHMIAPVGVVLAGWLSGQAACQTPPWIGCRRRQE